MLVTMKDTVETSHTIVTEIEDAEIVAQDGLRVLSQSNSVAGGLSGVNYVLLLTGGASLDLPDRLAKRLVRVGHAE